MERRDYLSLQGLTVGAIVASLVSAALWAGGTWALRTSEESGAPPSASSTSTTAESTTTTPGSTTTTGSQTAVSAVDVGVSPAGPGTTEGSGRSLPAQDPFCHERVLLGPSGLYQGEDMYYDGTSAQLGQEADNGRKYGETLDIHISMQVESSDPPVVDVVVVGGGCRLTVLGSFSAGNPVTVHPLLGQTLAFRAGTAGTFYASSSGEIAFGEFLGYWNMVSTSGNHTQYV